MATRLVIDHLARSRAVASKPYLCLDARIGRADLRKKAAIYWNGGWRTYMVCGTRFQMGSRLPITIHEVNLFLRVLGHVASQHNPGRADYGFALANMWTPSGSRCPERSGPPYGLAGGCGDAGTRAVARAVAS